MGSLILRITFSMLVAIPMTAGAQEGLLHLFVMDSLDGSGIVGVPVVDDEGRILALTDREGYCVVHDARRPLDLHLSHVSHGKRVVRVGPGVSELTVRWSRVVLQLPEAEVLRDGPEVVMRNDALNVAEFEITEAGLWVLAYGSPRLVRSQADAGRPIYRDVTLYLLDTLWGEVARVPMLDDVLALHRDHRGGVYVETPTMAYACRRSGRSILLEKVAPEVLHEAILPWTDSLPGWLIGNNDDASFYAFDHIAYDPRTDDARVYCTVEDDFTRELFRSQYKYMSGHDKVVAMDLALRTGVDKQVIAGYMTGFQHDKYFHPPYAPVFVVDDTLCVFDHCRGAIRRFTSALLPAGEVPIDYHRRDLWKGRLLQDAEDEQVYVLEMKSGVASLRVIDPRRGTTGGATPLTHRFPEQVAIYDGYAYYVYRPFGSLQTRWLYRQRIQ